MKLKSFIVIFMFVLVGGPQFAFSQSEKQKALEAERQSLLRQIKELNALYSSDKKKERSILTQVEDVNYKISVRRNLIKVTNDQANQLTREINANQKEITNLREQLKELKEDYAQMVVKTYKSRSEQSKVMFLLSSENFKQAYKRLQYINQYKEYQKQQAADIKLKTQSLQDLNVTLLKQKEDKQKLIAENRKAKRELEEEVKAQESLMASVKKDMNKHLASLKKKRQEKERIDREIDRLIREAIAASNKKAGKSTNSNQFVLTPEGKKLASNFEANKGKLGWPVERGVIRTRYGNQRSTIDNSVTQNFKGIRIATEKNAKVKAVFSGEVSRILVIKNANPGVMIRHGNYLTVYFNLSKVYVKPGDKIGVGQEIGEVFTNQFTGETLLGFRVYKNDKETNPEYWLAKK
ncbi:peptidoglycan DD-metalloendopeptidase family protein [Winogradskyella maritima]|uniref:Murein hydrolase activator EnvC family protein n=1 Tax=Winogradskyella maritima TaxID=1517766 RepID=A0ABV8AGZ4_9FLAO|nr:peptidoglycan DD-metalloendopeptidase family protein [Winogradskyella maritima]